MLFWNESFTATHFQSLISTKGLCRTTINARLNWPQLEQSFGSWAYKISKFSRFLWSTYFYLRFFEPSVVENVTTLEHAIGVGLDTSAWTFSHGGALIWKSSFPDLKGPILLSNLQFPNRLRWANSRNFLDTWNFFKIHKDSRYRYGFGLTNTKVWGILSRFCRIEASNWGQAFHELWASRHRWETRRQSGALLRGPRHLFSPPSTLCGSCKIYLELGSYLSLGSLMPDFSGPTERA